MKWFSPAGTIQPPNTNRTNHTAYFMAPSRRLFGSAIRAWPYLCLGGEG